MRPAPQHLALPHLAKILRQGLGQHDDITVPQQPGAAAHTGDLACQLLVRHTEFLAVALLEIDRLPEAGINPFVNVRLTTLAVTTLSPTGGVFLQNQKAVQYEFGGAFLYVFPGSADNFAGAVGPVARYMLQTITEPEQALRIWDLTNDTFNAWTFGVRGSVLKKTRDGAHWEHAAYVDFSWGKFQNYETATGNTIAAQRCLLNPTSCLTNPPPSTDFTIVNNIRTYIQARVVLGFLYAGFDFNLGEGRDDTKFVIGGTIALSQFSK